MTLVGGGCEKIDLVCARFPFLIVIEVFLDETKVDVDDIDAVVDAIAYRIPSFSRYQQKRVFFCEELRTGVERRVRYFFLFVCCVSGEILSLLFSSGPPTLNPVSVICETGDPFFLEKQIEQRTTRSAFQKKTRVLSVTHTEQ
jgi:hypothetical protein